MTQSYVYVLFDAQEPEHWRYVGVSTDPYRRLADHVKESLANSARAAYKGAWIRKVYGKSSTVDFRVIEAHSNQDEAYQAEPWWIEHLRSSGHRLTNTSSGGDGFLVNPWTNPVSRERMLQRHRARVQTKEYLDQTKAHWQAYWADPANRESQAKRTRTWWQAHPKPKKIVEPKNPDDTSKLISANMKNIWADPTARASRIQSIRNSGALERSAQTNRTLWSDPDYKAQRSMNISLGRRRAKATRNGWMLEVIS